MPGVEQAAYYECALPAMIASWRVAFDSPVLPFGVFSLAPYRSSEPTDPGFPLLRLQQAALAARDSAVFFISTLDGGDPIAFAIHSPYKEKAGARGALGVRAVALGDARARYLGPRAVRATVGAAGGALTVAVDFSGPGLYGAPLVLNTSIACPGKLDVSYCESFAVLTSPDCVWRSAEVPGAPGVALTAFVAPGAPSVLALTLSGAPKGLAVVAARNGFAPWPVVQLTNVDGTPAEPFLLDAVPHACGAGGRHF